jgi:hypothetical protein
MMQDGGPLADGVLKLYEEGKWTEFNTRFLALPTETNPAAAEAR